MNREIVLNSERKVKRLQRFASKVFIALEKVNNRISRVERWYAAHSRIQFQKINRHQNRRPPIYLRNGRLRIWKSDKARKSDALMIQLLEVKSLKEF